MRKTNTLILFWMILLSGCSVASENWNDHIDAESRAQIKMLNTRVIEAFNENNPGKIKAVFSDELLKKSGGETDTFVGYVHRALKIKNYSLLDEYLASNSITGSSASATKSFSGENDYKINYPVITKETYISLLMIDETVNKHLLTCIYGKYGKDWKLTVLRVGDYAFFGKTAIDFYKEATTNYTKGNLIDASIGFQMFKQTASPAANVFEYKNLNYMTEFADNALEDIHSKIELPKKIVQVKTNPQVLKISAKQMQEGIFPSVAYLSKINLKDTVALKKENDELKKVIGNIFPGIDKKKKYVFFRAYNEIPTDKMPVESYGFILNTTDNKQ